MDRRRTDFDGFIALRAPKALVEAVNAFTIDDFVMAITAAAAAVRHVASHRTSGMRPIQGRLVMIAMVMFTLLTLALALPGLVTLAMCGATEVQ